MNYLFSSNEQMINSIDSLFDTVSFFFFIFVNLGISIEISFPLYVKKITRTIITVVYMLHCIMVQRHTQFPSLRKSLNLLSCYRVSVKIERNPLRYSGRKTLTRFDTLKKQVHFAIEAPLQHTNHCVCFPELNVLIEIILKDTSRFRTRRERS